jgi:hypothetical protein
LVTQRANNNHHKQQPRAVSSHDSCSALRAWSGRPLSVSSSASPCRLLSATLIPSASLLAGNEGGSEEGNEWALAASRLMMTGEVRDRHIGHVAAVCSQELMQAAWNLWPQASDATPLRALLPPSSSPPSSSDTRQMAHCILFGHWH